MGLVCTFVSVNTKAQDVKKETKIIINGKEVPGNQVDSILKTLESHDGRHEVRKEIIIKEGSDDSKNKMRIEVKIGNDDKSGKSKKEIIVKEMDKSESDKMVWNDAKGKIINIEEEISMVDTGKKSVTKRIMIVTDGSAKSDTLSFKIGGKTKSKNPKNYDGLIWDFGLNSLLSDGSFDLSSDAKGLKLNQGKSTTHNFSYQFNRKFIGNGLRVMYGIGLESNNYRFSSNNLIKYTNDTLNIAPVGTTKYEKNKLVTTYLNVPLMFMYMSNPNRQNKSFNLGLGAEASVLIGSYQKVVTSEGGNNKQKYRGDFNLNPARISLIGRIGYGDFNFFVKYSMSEMFNSGVGSPRDLNQVSAGITLGLF